MRNRVLRLATLAACLSSLVVLTGCPIGLDVVNPDFLAQLGVPSTSTGNAGKLLIAYTNNSQSVATFYSTSVWSQSSGESGTRLPSVLDVAPGENWTIVEDCPVDFVVPGQSDSGLAVSGASVEILNPDRTVLFTLTFSGAALESGDDYLCGDVIEMELVQIGTGEAVEDFVLRVRVRPGR